MFNFLSRLVLGNRAPKNWSFPAPVYDPRINDYVHTGIVWAGKDKATPEDIKALAEYSPMATPDPLSLVGKRSKDPKWDTQRNVLRREIAKEVSWYNFRG